MITRTIHENWHLTSPNQEQELPAVVPGTVHTDLLANKIIVDPFWGTHEADLQWIDKQPWVYKTTFEVEAQELAHDHIILQFQGLDTYATIYLNEVEIGYTDHYFIAHEFVVKSILVEGANDLKIVFDAPIQRGLALLAEHGYSLPADNDQAQRGGLAAQEQVSVFTRKPGYHYGWDWGPRLVPTGIHQPVQLIGWNKARLLDLHIKQCQITDKDALMEGTFEVEAIAATYLDIQLFINGTIIQERNFQLNRGINKITIPFTIEDPKLWWTHDLGVPYLYDVEGHISWAGKTLDTKKHRIGIRTIKLVQAPDATGTSFHFELNGLPLFAKGANYIPNDVFLPRVTHQKYDWILESALNAHMNMLRVWGGGFYENQYFYERCDELGILVWQDFMFACSMYPGHEAFLNQVSQEATYQIKRLRNHSCIALWCGNNEMDMAWQTHDPNGGWGWKQRYDEAQIKTISADYDQLFHHLLPGLVAKLDHTRFYWPSSPYYKEGAHASDNTLDEGDTHYWGVWHGQQPFDAFERHVSRFVSEYGFQSFPALETVKQYALPQDWDIESAVMRAHQRSGIGNLRIRSYMELYFHVPDDFAHFLYVSQLLQAMGIGRAIEVHRLARPHCMGSLYWQLNDCWPVTSWSSMDYYGRWKALHYKARAAFAPCMIGYHERDHELQLSIVSDKLGPIQGIISITYMDFYGELIDYHSFPATAAAMGVTPLQSIQLDTLHKANTKESSFLHLKFHNLDEVFTQRVLFLADPKALKLPANKKLDIEVIHEFPNYRIKLLSPVLLKDVYLNFEGVSGWFSNNYFDLLPNEATQVSFKPQHENVELELHDLQVITLNDLKGYQL